MPLIFLPSIFLSFVPVLCGNFRFGLRLGCSALLPRLCVSALYSRPQTELKYLRPRLSLEPSMPKTQTRVLIALGWYDYRLHRGIEKYALEHNWHLTADLAREKVIPWGWEGDGI